MKKCGYCGDILEGKSRKFCSKKCSSKSYSYIQYPRKMEVGKVKKCEWCSKEFVIGKRYKFCSKECKYKKHNELFQIRLTNNPKRREILDKKVLKKREQRGIDLNLPIKSPKPKGSGHLAKSGYRLIHRKGHPNARTRGMIAEHTWIMSEYLGRALFKHESVHHKNRMEFVMIIENLELWSKSQPSGQRLEDKIEWCKDFLEQYGYKIVPPVAGQIETYNYETTCFTKDEHSHAADAFRYLAVGLKGLERKDNSSADSDLKSVNRYYGL